LTWNTKDRQVGRGIFQGKPPNVINVPQPIDSPHARQDTEITQINRIFSQMKNEIIRLRRNDEQMPKNQYHNPRVPSYGFRDHPEWNENIDDPIPMPRAHWIQNPNSIVMEENSNESPWEDYQFLEPQ
jgi:hypothetical protein